jgi:hypothetical protein
VASCFFCLCYFLFCRSCALLLCIALAFVMARVPSCGGGQGGMSLSSGRVRASERCASFLGDSLPVLRGRGVPIFVRHRCVHGRGLPNGCADLGHGATIFDTSSSSIGSYH